MSVRSGDREDGRETETRGICCGSLKDDKILMKMGLGLVLVGHVNFLLGSLVHGAVLRHIKVITVDQQLVVYPISNVIALVAGLMAIIVGISAIVLSKNKKNQLLSWFLLVVSVLAFLLGGASAVGICVATVRAIMFKGKTLFVHCQLPANISYYSITNECPFDPTRIYVVFSCRCFLACTSFLRLRCPWRKNINKRVQVQIQEPEETGGSEGNEEPTEHHDLLDKDTPAVETSDWL
ncbi:transmembrane protein 54a isoform X3 [Triplophysa rosa]|uniref:transmembrane protein 54a isoform X3 n=1 Tax=Triplophysa rosa TaxID=992332 RepID=UPI002545E34F|nr:transmembrane protein 54a isoform X3 [Triplophysa rosa]